jgi:hypothetical protein
MRSGLPSRIFRVHCEGTKIAFYTLLGSPNGDHSVYYSPDPPLKQHGFSIEYWDTDLLEPLGFDRLLSHAMEVRQAVGVREEHWDPDTSQHSVVTAFTQAGIKLMATSVSFSYMADVKPGICVRNRYALQVSA